MRGPGLWLVGDTEPRPRRLGMCDSDLYRVRGLGSRLGLRVRVKG